MVLAGLVIALGVLVDDAIIDIENIVRRIREARRAGSTRVDRLHHPRGLGRGSRPDRATRPAIILVSIVPVFLLGGLTGSFFRPLAFAYALADPGLARRGPDHHPGTGIHPLAQCPASSAGSLRLCAGCSVATPRCSLRSSSRPGYASAPSPRSSWAASWSLPMLGQNLFPAFKERDFLMHWVAEPGTSRAEMVRITTQASKELRAIPGVRNFGAHIGQAHAGRRGRRHRTSRRTGSASTRRSTTPARSPPSRRS